VEEPRYTLNSKLQGPRAGLNIWKKRKICFVVIKSFKTTAFIMETEEHV